MIHGGSGFVKAGLKVRRQAILFAAVIICLPVTANAQGISAPPGLAAPAPPRQPISNPGAANPAPNSNPVCVRLEGQLTALTQGSVDPVRAEQIKRTEDAIAKQQADLDRTIAQAHKGGCAGQGFFALFSALSPQCGPITSQIQQMRGNLDRMISDLEQLKSGNSGQEGQRRALIGQLAQNNCGAQYTAAANSWGGPQGFFDALFGGTIINPGGGVLSAAIVLRQLADQGAVLSRLTAIAVLELFEIADHAVEIAAHLLDLRGDRSTLR